MRSSNQNGQESFNKRKAIREQLKQAANQEARQKQIEQEIQMIEEVLEI